MSAALLEVALLKELRGAAKSEIRIHRKQKAKGNIDPFETYEGLLSELDNLGGGYKPQNESEEMRAIK